MDILTRSSFQSTSMEYLSIYLSLLQFLSTALCTFRCACLFTALVKFILSYFIFCVVIVNGIYFFMSLSGSSLLTYRNATDFFGVNFVPCNFMCLFIISFSFLVESLGFCIYKVISSANSDSFTSFFPICIL